MAFSTDQTRVLHVDDEPDFAEMAAEFIQRQDERLDVETATSADEALGRLRENQIHCIVSDFDMPGQNGIEFLETVREEYPDLPFILFTGKGSEEIASDAISAGVTDYLQKGSGTSQYEILVQRIKNAVRAAKAEHELQETLSRVTDAVYTLDTDWRITYVNEGTEEVMGPKEELLGENLWEQFPEAAEGIVWEKYHEAMETQDPQSFEIYYDPLDLWAAVRVYPSSTGLTVYFQDITERKRREQEYEATIEFLRELYDTATATELTPDEKITRLLEVGPEIVGLPHGYLTRIEVPEIGQSDGTQRVIMASGDHELLQPGNSCPLSESYCRKTIEMDGVMEVYNAPEEGWDGDPAFELFNLGCYIGTSISVDDEVYGTVFFAREDPRNTPFTNAERTFVRLMSQLVSYELERRETEEDLQFARERMEFALDATDSIIYAVDLETEESTDYGPVERVLGIEPTGMPDYLDRGVHPDDRHQVVQIFDAIRQGDSDVFDVEFRTAPDLGNVDWISSTGYVRERTGEAARQLIGLATDITDRKEHQRILENREQVLRSAYEIIADKNESVSEKIDALLAVGRNHIGTAYATFSRIDNERYEFEAIATAPGMDLEAGETTALIDLPICERVFQSGQPLVLNDVAADAPELDDPTWGIACYLGAPVVVNGESVGTFCFYDVEPRGEEFSDWDQTFVELLSDWVGSELTRQQAHDRLERRNKRLNEFASVVSHDLGNPLNVAAGRLELARETGESEHFDAAERALDRLDALIEDLANVMREGQLTNELTDVDLETVAKSCWETLDTDGATVEFDDTRPIRADEDALTRLLENLLRNALDHGGENVTVRIGGLRHGFYVEDDGAGISEDEREDIFEPGFSTKRDGTGFGMVSVKQIALAHGWDVTVTESSDGGARFEFTDIEFHQVDHS